MLKSIHVVLVAGACSTFLACGGGQKVALHAASTAPAAVGEVQTKQGDNGNTELKVEVEHLAPPQNIASGASVYVVWAKPHSEDAAQNLGALSIGDDRTGKLATKTPLKRFDLLVTPESSQGVSEPTGDPVLRTSIVAE